MGEAMSGQARPGSLGILQHVIIRGIKRQKIFRDISDGEDFWIDLPENAKGQVSL